MVHQAGQMPSLALVLWSLSVLALFSERALGTTQPGCWCDVVAAGMLAAALLTPSRPGDPCHLVLKETLPMLNTSEKNCLRTDYPGENELPAVLPRSV